MKPELSDQKRLRWGYVGLAGTGIVSLLISLDPPAFLIISIFWAFGMCACAVTPMIVLGAWSTRINRIGAISGSIIAGLFYIALSPYVFPDFSIGTGLVAKLGFAAALITVPMGFILTVSISLAYEKLAGSAYQKVLTEAHDLVEKMHGWPNVSGTRYAGTQWLWILCALWVPVLIWGLQPW